MLYRPFHDAVEYDHLEMARLVLACGADPMLSKFSGRAVMNMIRSEKMGRFMRGKCYECTYEISVPRTHCVNSVTVTLFLQLYKLSIE